MRRKEEDLQRKREEKRRREDEAPSSVPFPMSKRRERTGGRSDELRKRTEKSCSESSESHEIRSARTDTRRIMNVARLLEAPNARDAHTRSCCGVTAHRIDQQQTKQAR